MLQSAETLLFSPSAVLLEWITEMMGLWLSYSGNAVANLITALVEVNQLQPTVPEYQAYVELWVGFAQGSHGINARIRYAELQDSMVASATPPSTEI